MTTGPTSFDSLAPIAVADRSGHDESWHHGVAVAVDAGGEIAAAVGDPDAVVYSRSALKPLQAAAMVNSGLDVPEDELAVACASHDGAPIHTSAVLRLLRRFGLDEADLCNTPSLPIASDARRAARAAGLGPTSLQQNCSGKHAAMLATCRLNGWSTVDYLSPDHPVQRAIATYLDDIGCPPQFTGVDGCGAPNHGVVLRRLAVAVGALHRSGSAATRAMLAHPELVGGPERDVTKWMRAVPGLVAKDGAAGVMVMALPDGRAAGYKVGDGSGAARRAVAVEAARAIGVDVDELHESVGLDSFAVSVLGHGAAVGTIRPIRWSRCSS